MITIRGVQSVSGEISDWTIPSADHIVLEGQGLTLLPGLIDPHVHFRTPGLEHKENWLTAARASIAGGYTHVFDMPNTLPPTITRELLQDKKALIDSQLQAVGIPLRYDLFFGADKHHLAEIALVKEAVIGIKVFMGCSTGNLVIDDDESLRAVFKIAAENDMLVAVHAEDEARLHERKALFAGAADYAMHSEIRDVEAARIAVAKAIDFAREFGTRLYVLHASTQAELTLIANAKEEGLPVFAETTPHHLFLSTAEYPALQGRAVVNPPLRTLDHQKALWKAIAEGVIDTIGSDHAPHTPQEKALAYGQCPSGMPGIETTLPLLLNAVHEGRLRLQDVVRLTHERVREIFRLPLSSDAVLVDLNARKTVEAACLHTKAGWSSYEGMQLQGWPVHTILRGKVFSISNELISDSRV